MATFTLTTPLNAVPGVGPALAAALSTHGYETVRDLLLFLPLRYDDRSQQRAIGELQIGEKVTIMARIKSARSSYRGRRSFQSATAYDSTGTVKLMWFNNPHVVKNIHEDETYAISGQLNDRGTFLQPTIERLNGTQLHTGRLVPLYSGRLTIKPGVLRRVLHTILTNLEPIVDPLASLTDLAAHDCTDLQTALNQIHFPEDDDIVRAGRQRLALEELLTLMRRSHEIKQEWGRSATTRPVATQADPFPGYADGVPQQLPFSLTQAQMRSMGEVLRDLTRPIPMNRLLIGDVGAGKTVVAGAACAQVLASGLHTALIAPTQILAEQHAETFATLFPELPVQLVTSTTRKTFHVPDQPTVFIGTHAVLPRLEAIDPALIVYDEQHRFGVGQRSTSVTQAHPPHILTMTATPIPRSLMLSIFAHVSLSTLDELPPGRQPTKTWLLSEKKRQSAYEWAHAELCRENAQMLVICPFIDPSAAAALENVAAASELFTKLQTSFAALTAPRQLKLGLLHGRLSRTAQQAIIGQLTSGELDILVTTPMVEVGVDLPKANIIWIESAERFGLASLHQLRGRVGRRGQQGYCLLSSSTRDQVSRQRLLAFCDEHNGLKLAEMDLQRRGGGDLFGTQQHGFDQLQFADWGNVALIGLARELFEQVQTRGKWKSIFKAASQTDPSILGN